MHWKTRLVTRACFAEFLSKFVAGIGSELCFTQVFSRCEARDFGSRLACWAGKASRQLT